MSIVNILEELTGSNPDGIFSIAFFDLDRYLSYPEETRQILVTRVKEFIQKQICNNENVKFYWIERDEFVLIFSDFTKNRAKDFIDRLLKEIENEFKSMNMTSSAGVVQYPIDGLDIAELLRKAEEALNKAKRLGRNRAAFSDDKMVMRSNYYTSSQLNRLRILSNKLNRKESEILREILEEFLVKNGI